MDTGMLVTETLKEHCKFARLKNKTVDNAKVELVLEIKPRDEHLLEKVLSDISGIQQYSLLSFDRETRI